MPVNMEALQHQTQRLPVNGYGASSTTAATQQAAPQQQQNNDRALVIIVEILGYGGGEDSPDHPDTRRRDRGVDDERVQNSASPVQVIGFGVLSQARREKFTPTELRQFDEGIAVCRVAAAVAEEA